MIVALAGGVGGAKLAVGLAAVLPPGELTIVVNTGDDFEHLGFTICPDLDTVMYTLAHANNTKTGWGRAGEGWRFMQEMQRLGGPDWFQLGDRDLAVHVLRREALARGEPLSQVTRDLARRFGIRHAIVPMSDTPVRTRVKTATGELADIRRAQQVKWMWTLLEERLTARLRSDPAIRAKLAEVGQTTLALGPQESSNFVRSESTRFKTLIERNGIKLEQ